MAAHPVAFAFVLAVISGFHGFFKWSDAPNPVPVWWNIDAQPVYYLSRWFGFTFLPVLMVLIPYIFHVFACYDNKIKIQSGEPKHAVAHLISLPALFLFIVHNFIILDAFDSRNGEINPRFVSATVALFLMIWAGYNFQYVTPNHTVGLLTPWTLRSDSSWTKTHTHSAWILEIFGLVLLISAFYVPTGVPLLVVTLVLWLGSYLYLIIYSVIVFGSGELETGNFKEITEPLVATEA
ncbi:hypothetical protein R1sor_027239 [Riccia sorocarpa]|uniref:DUF1648 domain-containing protein n=1 Tax=Riccia sorocarpa TaxID=122646 RepID=A0ABD3GHB7_9MARC